MSVPLRFLSKFQDRSHLVLILPKTFFVQFLSQREKKKKKRKEKGKPARRRKEFFRICFQAYLKGTSLRAFSSEEVHWAWMPPVFFKLKKKCLIYHLPEIRKKKRIASLLHFPVQVRKILVIIWCVGSLLGKKWAARSSWDHRAFKNLTRSHF